MKVLKNNYNGKPIATEKESYPRTYVCEYCESELEYEKDDLRIGTYGAIYLDCPLCGHDNMFDEHEDEITLTIDNIEFPVHFHITSKEKGAVDTCNNEYVKECITRMIKSFRNEKSEDDWVRFTASGNTAVFVFKLIGDEEYQVYVADDYYETYIPFEGCDY